jgi:hypothetical protein
MMATARFEFKVKHLAGGEKYAGQAGRAESFKLQVEG